MQTKLKALWEKIKGFFGKLNKATRIVLAVCAVLILVAIIYYAVTHREPPPYEVLCTDLNASDTSAVIKFLNDNGVTDYKIKDDSILVPNGRADQLQIQLATSRIMDTGFLYEFYTDHTGSFSTEAERREAVRIAAEKKLEAMIRQFEGVKDASVNISLGSSRVYVLQDESTKSTVAVTLTPDDGGQISSGVIECIRYTVAHSVQELDIGDVSIVDTYGRPYNSSGSVGEMTDANALKMQFQQETNDKVQTAVLNILSPIYGPGNVSVSVNTTVDMDHRVVESTSYSQPEGAVNGGGLIGSEKVFWEIVRENGIEATGGVPGTSTNSDISIYPNIDTELNGEENLAAGNTERDHKIDTQVEQVEYMSGRITDVKVAVTINANSPNAGSLGVEELEDHVATASGIGAIDRNDPISRGRVSVKLAPFYEKDTEQQPNGGGQLVPGEILPGIPNWMIYAAAAGLLLFVVLLILILLMLRGRKKKKLARQLALEEEMRAAAEAAEAEAEAAAEAAAAIIEAAPPTGGADIMEVNTEKSMELRKLVRQFAQNNPEIAAQMVKAWLKGEDLSA